MNAVLEAVRSSRSFGPEEIKNVNAEMERVNEAISKCSASKDNLLPIEAVTKRAIESKAGELSKEKKRLVRLAKFGQYKRLDAKALRWRDDRGWPKLVLFSLDNSSVVFSCAGTQRWDSYYERTRIVWRKKINPTLPPELATCYSDVLEMLSSRAKSDKQSVFLGMQFGGVIPESTRNKIAEVKDKFRAIYIATEGSKLKLSTKKMVVIPRPLDPLVLGFDGDDLWIVDHFDMTPAERYIKNEFSV